MTEIGIGKRSGCAVTLIAFNIVIMGLTVLSFSQGPYSSDEQEYWYRYRSIGFLLGGAIVPAILLKLYGERSTFLNKAVFVWGLIALLAFLRYVAYSSGGV